MNTPSPRPQMRHMRRECFMAFVGLVLTAGAARALVGRDDAETVAQEIVKKGLNVRDVEAVYAELKPRLDTLPAGDVHGPADKSYGQRELLVLVPDGNLLAFGQAIRSADQPPSGG